MRKLTVLLVLLAMGAMGLTTGLPRGTSTAKAVPGALSPQQVKDTAGDPPGTISGAQNPEAIPDQVAYSLLLRLLSGRRTEAEKNRARSYLKAVFGCKDCSNVVEPDEQRAVTQAKINAFLVVAAEFVERLGLLDRQAKEVKDYNRANPSPNTATQLADLQKRKEALITEMMTSLPRRLGAGDGEKVRQFVNQEIKRKVKIIPPRSGLR